MRQVYNIARAELQSFFYSPVAWLILIIFSVMCGVAWSDTLTEVARHSAMGSGLPSLTGWFFTRETNGASVLQAAARYLYIFYPLLTMGLISRELANGSIRLLDSSPVTAGQVVWGKFLGMAIYSLLLLGVLTVFVVVTAVLTPDFNWPYVLVALSGVLLTMLTYSAIGLFISSLTRYPVVAAIGSFAIFMVLERIGAYGQQWAVARDITTWLSTSGRAKVFMSGLLASHHVIYYLCIIAMFIAFTILRLRLAHYHFGFLNRAARYLAVAAVAIGLGWLASRPAVRLYADTTYTQQNTLAPQSREVMERLRNEGPLTVTTYVNLMDRYRAAGLPRNITADKAGFERYQRFKPDMRFRYVYYYAPTDKPTGVERMKPGLTFEETARELARLTETPFGLYMTQQEVDALADLSTENYQFVRFLELDDGRSSVLRMYDEVPPWPQEEEIAVAFKRLAVDMPKVGFVVGHGERSIHDTAPTGYERVTSSRFNRFSLLNQGLEAVEVALADGSVPQEIDILVIADPRTAYLPEELIVLDDYLARGGNLVLLIEPDTHAITAPLLSRFAVELEPGQLAEPPVTELANVVGSTLTPDGIGELGLEWMKYGFRMVAMPGVGSLRPSGEASEYRARPLLATRPDAWNKIGKVDWIQGDTAPAAERGERTGTFTTAVTLTRDAGDGQQRIMIAADADWIDNNEVENGRQGFTSRPTYMAYYLFGWLSDGVAPMEIRRPEPVDTAINVTQGSAGTLRIVFEWLLPALLLLLAATVLIRRNRK